MSGETQRGQPRFDWSVVRHGTESGWSLHQKRGEWPCGPCFAAKAEADKRRKAPGSLQHLRGRLNAKAQRLALSALAREHREEYAALYQSYKAEIYADADLPTGRGGVK